jgi:hypothetical protein
VESIRLHPRRPRHQLEPQARVPVNSCGDGRLAVKAEQCSTAGIVMNRVVRTRLSASRLKKAKPHQEPGPFELSSQNYWARLPSNSRLCHAQPMVKTQKWGAICRVPLWLDGSAENRGIEPLRLQAAVQRLASVPSTHTGSVLRSRACYDVNCIHVTLKPVVTPSTISYPVPTSGVERAGPLFPLAISAVYLRDEKSPSPSPILGNEDSVGHIDSAQHVQFALPPPLLRRRPNCSLRQPRRNLIPRLHPRRILQQVS